MALFIIASVVGQNGKHWNTLGYKVLNTGTGEFKLLSEPTIQNLGLKIENAEFINNELRGTMGDLKRYTQLNAFDGYPVKGTSIVILGKDSEGYFLVVEKPELESNLIRRMSPYELKGRIKVSNGTSEGVIVANARVENPLNIKDMIIRPIKGNFDIIMHCPKFTEKDFDFGGKQGNHSRKWKVRVVYTFEKYGRDYCLINEKKPLILFFDMDVDKEKFPIGQEVSSYYLDSIQGKQGALNLNSEVDKWFITSESMKEIQEWLDALSVR